MKEKDIRITARVDEREKEKIFSNARKCGLSASEYVKQRALGYEPTVVPTGALFTLLEKIGELGDKTVSAETDAKICMLLTDITNTLLLPEKEDLKLWQSQVSGRSSET